MSELLDSLNNLKDALEDALEPDRNLVEGPAIQTTNQLELAKSFLNQKTLLALSKKAISQVIQTPGTMEGYICIYISVLVKTVNILKGIELISNSLNALTEKDLIHSTLAVPSSLNLLKVFGKAPTSVVYSFVLVPMNRKRNVKRLPYMPFKKEK